MVDNEVILKFKLLGHEDYVQLEINKGEVEISQNDKYLDNKILRSVHIAETRKSHVIEDFWKTYHKELSNNSIESFDVIFANEVPMTFTNIIAVRYQDVIFSRSEGVYPKRLMLAINVYED